jgi:Transglycosylase SLT domain
VSADAPALPRLGGRLAGAAAALAGLSLLLIVAMLALLFGVQQQPSCAAAGSPTPIAGEPIPGYLVPFYEGAASRYRLGARGPAVLAAINGIESSFGQNPGTSNAGAVGWMQFEPSTWAKYGVDADHDGKRDPYDPQDAIYGAANYLHASGAPQDWERAVLAYNHAQWYADAVLGKAGEYQAAGLAALSSPSDPCAGGAPPLATGRLAALAHEADRISRKNFPYVWGGGHTQPAPDPDHTTGYDCSGAVSRLVQAAGYPYPTADTTILEREWKLPRGPGTVTVFLKPTGPEAHVFVRIRERGRERFWGTSDFARPNGGAGWFTQTPGVRYLRGFAVYHLPGLA